jgi:uncharacterized protein with PIN domain
MILDTSAIIAAIAAEPDGAQFQTAMEGAKSLAIAAITVLETRIVLHRRRQPFLAQALRSYRSTQISRMQLSKHSAATATAKVTRRN